MAVIILTTLILIFNFILKCCATSPAAVDPRSTTVMEGTNVTLYCTIIKNSSEAVSWTSSHSLSVLSRGRKIVREGLVSSSQYNRLSISGNSDLGEYNLNFQNVQPEDVSQYSCGYFSVSQRQAIFSPKAVLTVISPPVCEHYPQNLELAPGNSIQMICTSQNNRPNTDLTWLRNGQTLRGGTRVGQAELSNSISYLLTEDDFDQPFTCIESMSPLSYVPHCSITPLRQTLKPVHIAKSQEEVTVGSISHLTCLTNPSFDSLSYRWLVDSSLTSSTSKIYSFGPVSSGDNGTSITCEVHRDGELYGRDEMVIIVTPEPEAAYIPVTVDTTTSKSFEKSTYTPNLTDNTGNFFNDDTFTITRAQTAIDTPEAFTTNPIEGYVIIFIVVSASIGMLLLITIFCLAMVLARYKESPNRYNGSQEKIDTSSTNIEMREPSDFDEHSRTFAESNIINEHIEAQKSFPPHYHTLEPNSRSSERKERRMSDCSVPYSVVCKPKKASKKDEGQLGNGCQGGDLAYAVTPVIMTNGRRFMSAKRPLPERPDNSPEYKTPSRSYSEMSKANYMQKKGQDGLLREAGNLEELPIAENSSSEVVKRRTSSKDQSNLVIETEYTEVRDGSTNMQGTLVKSEEKAYEFTTVYDSLEDEKNNVLAGNPDSGFHDSSSTEGAEVDADDKEGQRSETITSLLNSNNFVKYDADDNLYASLE